MALIINDVAARVTYTATASQTVFTVPFEFFDNTDLVVYVNGTLATYDPTPIDATEYSAVGAGTNSTKEITFGAGSTLNDEVVIYRSVPLERLSDFPSSGPFNIETLNTELDTLVALLQQQRDIHNRSIRLANKDGADTLAELPDKDSLANKILGFDANGDPVATAAGGSGDMLASVYDPTSVAGDAFDMANMVEAADAKVLTAAERTKLAGVEASADVTDATNVGTAMTGATAKTTPVDADTMPLNDSAASNVLKKVTWANVKATLKTYFDTLYQAVGTYLTAANNLSDVANAGTARTNLGVAIGSDVQAYDADLAAIAALAPAQGDILYRNASAWTLLAAGTSGQFLKTLGAAANPTWDTIPGGGDMLSSTYDPATVSEQLVGLTAAQTLTNKTLTQPTITLKQGLTPTPTAEGDIQWDTDNDQIKIGDGTGTKVFSDDSVNAATYQPLDADLTAIAALANTDGNVIVGNGSAWVVESGATLRTSLGLGTGDSPQFTGIEVGAATDTTVTRSAAGQIAVEGKRVLNDGDKAAVTFVIDGGGSAISTGIKGDIEIPFACTIERVELLADQSGSIVIDIWKDTYANFPPLVADTITASAKPTLSAATKSEDATLTGWTTSVAAGDILRFNVDSASTVTRVTLTLRLKRT